ncbi:hypothetical protein [Actinomadura litoris]|uniref:hypothetical protein n=1 Tax=Actinomadura litoris TaxID=2678616 RepID=UPI001FA7B162|nr:hypothetical protein [Actinomadura litoris]
MLVVRHHHNELDDPRRTDPVRFLDVRRLEFDALEVGEQRLVVRVLPQRVRLLGDRLSALDRP